MTWAESAALAAFFGTSLAALPAVRAAMYLRYRTKPKTNPNDDPAQTPLLDRYKHRLNSRLERMAQDWPSWLYFSFLFGVALLLYASAVQALLTFGVLTNGAAGAAA